MTVKTNQSMIGRFSGVRGKQRLLECVCKQQLVAGDPSLARTLIRNGSLVDNPMGRLVIKQGGSDNELYLIITGSVSVSVNGREIATRVAYTHFGEMALIDPTARRSSTVTTREKCTFLRITESSFTCIARKKPQLWRNMAGALSVRLHERNKFHPPPHSQPIVFIGSSSEGLTGAKAIQKSLSKRPVVSRLWSEGIFQASKTAIEDLLEASRDSDFAIIVLSSDDVCISRGKKKRIPRDNAVFELGLFMGALGRNRAFIITPSNNDIKIPTDLLGVTCLRYKKGAIGTIGLRLQPICRKLWDVINKLGPK